MRGATQCARRVKRQFNALRSKLGTVSRPSRAEPITQMILGVLSRDVPEPKAREALNRIRRVVVDYNELRVVPPIELAELLGDYPDVRLKCEDISRALNKIFALNHSVSLDHLSEASRKDVCDYLEQIDGLEAYSRARVRLLGLRQHAIPLDEAMWAYARQEQIVDARCSLEEAQAFLERRIPEEDALEFVALWNRQAWAELGSAVRRSEAKRIRSVPPDRTTRNMLQMIGGALEVEEQPAAQEPSRAPEPGDKSARAPRAAAARTKRAKPSAQSTRQGRAVKKKPSAARAQRQRANRAARAKSTRKGAGKKAAKASRRTTAAKAQRKRKRTRST